MVVEAENASNRRATGYAGTIALSASDATAIGAAARHLTLTGLPLTYTFTNKDHGGHAFHVQVTQAGPLTITATDTTTSSITGTATTTVNPVPVATSFAVQVPTQAATGVPTRVTVKVLDQAGHLLPNFTSHLIASATLAIPNMILGETALSFLGLGLRPPITSWGVLLQEVQTSKALRFSPWLLAPIPVVVLVVMAFNFLGDGLRDAMDPYAK